MFRGGGFFFFEVIVDQARDAAATEAAGRFVFGLVFGIAHEAFVKGFFGADKVVIINSQA